MQSDFFYDEGKNPVPAADVVFARFPLPSAVNEFDLGHKAKKDGLLWVFTEIPPDDDRDGILLPGEAGMFLSNNPQRTEDGVPGRFRGMDLEFYAFRFGTPKAYLLLNSGLGPK